MGLKMGLKFSKPIYTMFIAVVVHKNLQLVSQPVDQIIHPGKCQISKLKITSLTEKVGSIDEKYLVHHSIQKWNTSENQN